MKLMFTFYLEELVLQVDLVLDSEGLGSKEVRWCSSWRKGAFLHVRAERSRQDSESNQNQIGKSMFSAGEAGIK